MKKNHSQRIDSLRRRLRHEGIAGILITNPINVMYLTGFTGDSTNLLVAKNKAVIVSDKRFEEQLEEECAGFEVEIRDSKSTTMALSCKVIQSARCSSLGVESTHMSKANFDEYSQSLPAVDLVDTLGWVEELRSIKDQHEIDAIRTSIRINERAFEAMRSQLRGDQTEREIANNLEQHLRSFGAKGCCFEPIVGVGARSALPHAVTTDRRIDTSPFVLVDWGAMNDHYVSDLTRVLITRKAPARYRRIYDIVLAAQRAAIDAVRPGATVQEVDRAARKTIENAGFGKFFGHGLGHGIGLQVHEVPFMSPIREGVLEAGMVVTVEPGIYLPKFGGVRIEDDVLVTLAGCEVLSRLPKEFDEVIVNIT